MLLLFTHFAFEAERYEDEVPEKKVHRLKPVLVHPNSLCLSKLLICPTPAFGAVASSGLWNLHVFTLGPNALSRCESQKVSRVVAFN